MVKQSKYNRIREIVKEEDKFKSKLPSMTERAFLIYKHTDLLPGLANLISDYALPSYRECIDFYTDNAMTTIGDVPGQRKIIECSEGTIDFYKHRGRKIKKKEFYINPKIEFYILTYGDRRETFFIGRESFITSLETEFWFLPDRRKIPNSEGFMRAIKLWLN